MVLSNFQTMRLPETFSRHSMASVFPVSKIDASNWTGLPMVEVWLDQIIKEDHLLTHKAVLIEMQCRHNNSHITKVDLVLAIKVHHQFKMVVVEVEVANRKAIKYMLEILIQVLPTKCCSILSSRSTSLFSRQKLSLTQLVEFPKDMVL